MLCSRLTVEFSPPWWVGTLERWEDGRYEVGRVVFGAEPTEPGGTSLGAAPAVPAADHSGDGSACPPSRGTEPQAAAASDCPGAAASGRKEGLGSCGSGMGSRKADTPSADGRGAPGGSQGTVPAAPAEAAAEAPGTLIPVCPAVHNTPAGTIPAGVFFISCAKIYNPLLVPLPQNPYDNRGTFIKRKRLPWQSIIPMPPDACPCPGGKS